MSSLTSVCEKQVYKSLYFKFSEQLRNYFYYKCGDFQQADDYLQEAFIRLWKNCEKISIESAKSFLYKAGTNLFLHDVAHSKVKLKFAAYQKGVANEDSRVDSPDYKMEQEEFRQKLELAISNLTEAQREVFLMNRLDGMKYREIAEILGISQKAVEKRMAGALKELRKIYKKI